MLYPTELRGLAKTEALLTRICPRDCLPNPQRPALFTASRPGEAAEPHRIVGITYSAPERIPAGQRAVTVFSRV